LTERSNDDWVRAVRTPGATQEAALADLRAIILAGLRPALAETLPPTDAHFAALAEDVAQETLLAVLDLCPDCREEYTSLLRVLQA